MTALQFMGEHPFLTIFLAIIAMYTVIYVSAMIAFAVKQ